jgi:hypothetical protein
MKKESVMDIFRAWARCNEIAGRVAYFLHVAKAEGEMTLGSRHLAL